jgi:hypothetical protein
VKGGNVALMENGTAFLQEFKDFIAFLKNLWGILAGISVIFPLSNILTKVIPLHRWEGEAGSGAWYSFSPVLVSILASLIALFIILWTFVQRYKIKAQRNKKNLPQAGLLFILGISALIIYLLVYSLISNYEIFWSWFNWESGDPRRLIGDVILLIFYCAFFAAMTRAFVLLGLIEFLGSKRK